MPPLINLKTTKRRQRFKVKRQYYKRTFWHSKFIRRILGFSVVGFITSFFSMFLTFLGNEIFYLNVFLTYILSYLVSILFSYFLNTCVVFKKKIKFKGLLMYYGVYISSMILGLGILKIYDYCLPTWNKTLISYMVIPFTTLFNFFFVSKIMNKMDVR